MASTVLPKAANFSIKYSLDLSHLYTFGTDRYTRFVCPGISLGSNPKKLKMGRNKETIGATTCFLPSEYPTRQKSFDL
jgi:hypothetical protein